MEQKDVVQLPNKEVQGQRDPQFQHKMLRTEPKECGLGGQSWAMLGPQSYIPGLHQPARQMAYLGPGAMRKRIGFQAKPEIIWRMD